jgi:hypothetical protein
MSSTSNENNFRTSAYEAITSYVSHATPDVIGIVQNTIVTILQRMEHLLDVQVRCNFLSLETPPLIFMSRIKYSVLMIAITGTNYKATSVALLS